MTDGPRPLNVDLIFRPPEISPFYPVSTGLVAPTLTFAHVCARIVLPSSPLRASNGGFNDWGSTAGAPPGLGVVLLAGVFAAAAGAEPKEFVIEPYYVSPADQPYHPEYESALRDHIRQVHAWYRDKVGENFHLGKLRVVQSQQPYLTMRCGPFATFDCIADRERLPFWLGSVLQTVGGLEPRTGKWIFAQGGGGFAGANLIGNYEGFALAADWTLEPISGVVEPEAITCAFSDGWQCAIDANGNGAPYGTGPHELGHVFGFHHPDGYDGMSLMKWHGDYPSTTLMPHEVMILRETPWFRKHAFDAGAPFLNFETQDVAHWGDPMLLSGVGFLAGDTVEFRDVNHSVRVEPIIFGSGFMQATVPTGMGYIRI